MAQLLVLASISESIVNETAHFVSEAGLPGVFALMALSSACIPIPSEVVMLFAGFAVAEPAQSGASHHMTMIGVLLAGLLGTMVGSWAAYAVGRAGRLELLERHGAKLHMGRDQIQRADRFFARWGEPTVLVGRVIPLVRAFVSLPAGVAKMPLGRFTLFSLIGTIPWVAALAFAGHALGGDWKSVRTAFEYLDYAVVALAVVAVVYGARRSRASASVASASDEGAREAARGAERSEGAEPGTSSPQAPARARGGESARAGADERAASDERAPAADVG
jgi:membrane protein DedA with SNARE-associated domain